MIRTFGLAVGMTLALSACATTGGARTLLVGKAELANANGVPTGLVELNRVGDRLRLSIATFGLSPGDHGIHLHTIGKCEGSGFAGAGAHLNPGAHQHGSANPAGSHLGDLPNLVVDSKGAGVLFVDLPGTAEDALAQLFDADGTAVVIHAAADDYRTDPSGNSGARIACGVLTRSAP